MRRRFNRLPIVFMLACFTLAITGGPREWTFGTIWGIDAGDWVGFWGTIIAAIIAAFIALRLLKIQNDENRHLTRLQHEAQSIAQVVELTNGLIGRHPQSLGDSWVKSEGEKRAALANALTIWTMHTPVDPHVSHNFADHYLTTVTTMVQQASRLRQEGSIPENESDYYKRLRDKIVGPARYTLSRNLYEPTNERCNFLTEKITNMSDSWKEAPSSIWKFRLSSIGAES